MTEFICTGCGRPTSALSTDHEVMNVNDTRGWPIVVCNYGVKLTDYTIEAWGI